MLVHHRTIGRENVIAWERYAGEHVAVGNVRIENAEFPDDCAALIRKKRVRDVMRVGEALQRRLAIIADSGDSESCAVQRWK
jgi:hypothetical protein